MELWDSCLLGKGSATEPNTLHSRSLWSAKTCHPSHIQTKTPAAQIHFHAVFPVLVWYLQPSIIGTSLPLATSSLTTMAQCFGPLGGPNLWSPSNSPDKQAWNLKHIGLTPTWRLPQSPTLELFYPGPGHPPRPDLVVFSSTLVPNSFVPERARLRMPDAQLPLHPKTCPTQRLAMGDAAVPRAFGDSLPTPTPSPRAALTRGPKRTGGAGYKPRPLAQAQGGTQRPPFPSQRINRSSTEKESVNAKSLCLPLSMCAAEVDRHVAHRYLIKRRLGKGVSAGTPRHLRGTAVI